MSAVLKDAPVLGRMSAADLPDVVAVERAIYTHPWTQGNFADSLHAGYHCHTLRLGSELIGYFVLMVAAGESHLLNLSVAGGRQRRGHGASLLREAMHVAREAGAHNVYLEVRPGNAAAQALYAHFGFRQIAVRRDYYPVDGGREDALVYTRSL